MSVLFLQNRPTRAGAQTSLARLADSDPIRILDPLVLVSKNGWLSEQLERQGTPCFVVPFKSPRALASRIFGLKGWAKLAVRSIVTGSARVRSVIANDHQECPLALALARELGGLPVVSILRSSGMSEGGFRKYGCERSTTMLAVGSELQKKVQQWSRRQVLRFDEGFLETEFGQSRPWLFQCPGRLLLIGSEAPGKGFTDFIEALRMFEQKRPEFPGWECDVTARLVPHLEAALAKPLRSRFRFLGRIDDFSQRIAEYSFAVHPSRAETFGMAPVEAMLAGTPTLVSTTGVAGELGLSAHWTFPAGNISALCERLEYLWQQWPFINLSEIQQEVRNRFHIKLTASVLSRQINNLWA
jgi:glycosyltransferase involved in cell wall biosynthesis